MEGLVLKQNSLSEVDFSQKDIDLIRETVAPKCSESELKLFLIICTQYKLNPLLKEAWCIKYDERRPASIFAGRDGFRSIAHRTGKLDGIVTESDRINEPFKVKTWDKGKRQWVELEFDTQFKATCTVYRSGSQRPFVKTVYEEEYNTGKSTWLDKRRTMIEKVAEAQCLKQAFNINGIYDEAEAWKEIKNVEDSSEVAVMAERGHEQRKKELEMIEEDPTNISKVNDEHKVGVEELRDRIGKSILEITDGNEKEAKILLKEVSSFKGKDGNMVEGVFSRDQLTGKRLRTVYGKVKELSAEYRADTKEKSYE